MQCKMHYENYEIKEKINVSAVIKHIQAVLLLHSHDRHASTCLVTVPAFILSLNAAVQGICCCIQNWFCQWSSHFKRFVAGFQVISAAGRFAASYFVTEPLFNIISVAGHFAPSFCFIELFSRLIATLRVRVVSSALRINFCRRPFENTKKRPSFW